MRRDGAVRARTAQLTRPYPQKHTPYSEEGVGRANDILSPQKGRLGTDVWLSFVVDYDMQECWTRLTWKTLICRRRRRRFETNLIVTKRYHASSQTDPHLETSMSMKLRLSLK